MKYIWSDYIHSLECSIVIVIEKLERCYRKVGKSYLEYSPNNLLQLIWFVCVITTDFQKKQWCRLSSYTFFLIRKKIFTVERDCSTRTFMPVDTYYIKRLVVIIWFIFPKWGRTSVHCSSLIFPYSILQFCVYSIFLDILVHQITVWLTFKFYNYKL